MDGLEGARLGFERVAPPLPGFGPVLAICSLDCGIAVIRATRHPFAPAIYVLPDGAREWERVYLN